MIKKRYKLPIKGTVVERVPLKGLDSDPVCVIPLNELADFPTYYDKDSNAQVLEGFRYTCLEYNVDQGWCEIELEASEKFHIWLIKLIPQLQQMPKRFKYLGE